MDFSLTFEQAELGKAMHQYFDELERTLSEMIRRDQMVERANALVAGCGSEQLIQD